MIYKGPKTQQPNCHSLYHIQKMRSTFPILICCLYALSAVDATPFSKRGNAEVQQGNAKAVKPLNFWSDDKSDDDDKDDKWSKDDEDDHYGGNGQDDCASRSVSVLIGTSTYAIPCLQGDSIVNLNGVIPTPEASSSAVSSSAVDSSSSDASSAADSTTTTTDSTTTTTDTTTSADSSPTFTVTLYSTTDCSGNPITTSLGSGCFNYNFSSPGFAAIGTTSTIPLMVNFYLGASCAGDPLVGFTLIPNACDQIAIKDTQTLSYSVNLD